MSRIHMAVPEDAARIAEIYRPYVENTAVTFEIEPPDEAEMRARIVEHLKAYPYLVMEEDGRVIGYAYGGAFHERVAYRPTVELSVYMDAAFRGAGRGEALVRALLESLRADPRYFVAMAVIVHPNPPSERLFERLGFEVVGRYENVGWKLGAWRSVYDYLLRLKPEGETPDMNERRRK